MPPVNTPPRPGVSKDGPAAAAPGDRQLTGTDVPKNVNNKWTADADDQLRSLIQSNTPIHFVAAEMERSVPALKGRRISCI